MKFLFKNRVKPLAIAQLLLMIPAFILFIVADSKLSISLLQIILALICLLLGIERFILKKRIIGVLYFVCTVMFILLVLHNTGIFILKY